MYRPSREEFEKSVALGVPVVILSREVMLDTESPISVFLKLCDNERGYLLESIDGGEHVARYSFIGFDPFLVFSSKHTRSQLTEESDGKAIHTGLSGSPLRVLRDVLSRFKIPKDPDLPRFSGGLVGYIGYDVVRCIESLPGSPRDDLLVPDIMMMGCRKLVVFDHVTRRGRIILNIPTTGEVRPDYDSAVKEIEGVVSKLASPVPRAPRANPAGLPAETYPRYNTSQEDFVKSVRRAQEYIRSGDIFQVVLSQRAEFPLRVHPLSLYRTLRAVNPSPYMFYMDFGRLHLVGASPEMLVRMEDSKVETRPIAGTRKRGLTIPEDVQLEKDLLLDEKERAEHVMLVDLSRNDLGRICEYGSVSIPKFMEVERFSHVMHIVSEVTGALRAGLDAVDVLEACFPAGTLSGAPKVRAMEIIDELEGLRRGPYGGAVGYISFSGNMDTCITIRTALVHDGLVHVQAGAGIVYDSQPEREYAECIDKAQALFQALRSAEEVETTCSTS